MYISLVILLTAVVFFVLAASKLRKMAHLIEVRNHIARDLHDDIGATLTSISFYTQAATSKLKSGKLEEVQAIVNQTGISAREAIGNMNDIVWFINPKNDQLGSLFARINDYARQLFAEQQVHFFFYYNDDQISQTLNMEQRKNLYLICKEALTNAAKYAHAKNVELLIEKQSIIIKDDGVGFNCEDMSSGNGVMNMKERAHQLGAQFTIQSSLKKGTFIQIGFYPPKR